MNAEALAAKVEVLAAERDELRSEYDRLKVAYENVLVEYEKLRRQVFGRKAEAVDPAQASLAFQLVLGLVSQTTSAQGEPSHSTSDDTPERCTEVEPSTPGVDDDAAASPPPPSTDRPSRNSRGRRKLPAHLPIERIELLPVGITEDNRHQYELVTEETRETLAWRAASAVRLVVARLKVVLRRTRVEGRSEDVSSIRPNDESTPAAADTGAPASSESRKILMAELPDWVIPRCLAAPSMLAHVLVQKYAYHVPLHRMERMLGHQGLDVSRSTLCGWVETAANLLKGIVSAMAKDAMNSPWIGIDATGVLVQAKEQCLRGHFWVLVAARDHVLFRYSPRHVKEAPADFLKGYRGYVQADASNVYELLYRTEAVTEVGCHAHARRHFYDALGHDKERALAGIGFINELFKIERELRDMPPSRRHQERQRRSKPVLDDFEAWVDGELPKVVPKTPIAGALGYATNHRVPLRRFLDDGRLRIDNNLSELELRRQKVGAKNWLFVGSDDGAEWNATIVSLVASCDLHKLDPQTYFHEVLSVVQGFAQGRLLELAPKYWRETRARLLAAGKLVGEGLQTAASSAAAGTDE